jgi:hypothetical protein
MILKMEKNQVEWVEIGTFLSKIGTLKVPNKGLKHPYNPLNQ